MKSPQSDFSRFKAPYPSQGLSLGGNRSIYHKLKPEWPSPDRYKGVCMSKPELAFDHSRMDFVESPFWETPFFALVVVNQGPTDNPTCRNCRQTLNTHREDDLACPEDWEEP